MQVFVGLTIFLIVYRVISIGASWFLWYRLDLKRRKARTGQHKSVQRFPLVPFFMSIDLVVITIFFALCITNTVSAFDGFPLFLLWLWTLSSTPLAVLQTKKILRVRSLLNEKMKKEKSTAAHLSRIQRHLLVFQVLLYLAQAACSLVGVIDPRYVVEAARGNLASLALIMIVNFGAIGVEYQRCIRELQRYSKTIEMVQPNAIVVPHDWTGSVIFKLRLQQAAYAVAIPVVVAPLIYFLVALEFPWWMLLLFFGVSCLISTGVVVSMWPKKKKSRQKTEADSTAGNRDSKIVAISMPLQGTTGTV